MKRQTNGSIVLLRYLFTILVAVMHFTSALPGGILGVDFFFILAGYYQMQTMSGDCFSPGRYIVRRYLKFSVIYLASILASLVVFSPKNIISGLFMCIPDMLCLQMSGIFSSHANPVLWYVSSMMIASFFLALLYSYSRRLFIYLAPVIVALGYSMIRIKIHCLDATHLTPVQLVPLGTVRGFAGLSLGCMLYWLRKERLPEFSGKKASIILSLLEVSAAVLVFLCFTKASSEYDFYSLIAFPIIILCADSRQTIWSGFFCRIGVALDRILGQQYSFAAYCFSLMLTPIVGKLVDFDTLGLLPSTALYLCCLLVFAWPISRLSDILTKRLLRLAAQITI